MSNLAREIMAAIPADFDMLPVVVHSTSPLMVKLAGASTPVPASSVSGITFDVGATGYAFWKPPAPPLVIITNGGGGGGGASGSFKIYTHTQGSPAFNWTINHNLGHDPIIEEVLSSDGSIAEGFDVIHTNPGVQTVIGFDVAVSGTARLA